MKNKNLWLVVGVIVVVAAIILGVRLSQKSAPQKQVIKIGAILPLTGPASFAGELMKMGLDMAVEDLHAEGIHVRVLYQDSQGDPKIAINVFRQLTSLEEVKVIITTISPISLALKPLAEEQQIVVFANASHPEITKSTRFVFRVSQTVESDLKEFTLFLKRNANYLQGTIVVFYQADDYGNALVSALQASPEISRYSAKFVPYDPKQSDFRSLVSKELSSKQPPLVVGLGFTQSLGILIKQIREYGCRSDIYAALAFILTNAYKVAGDAADGIYHPDFDVDVNDPNYKDLETRFKEKFGKELSTASWVFYNNLLLLGRVTHEVGTSPTNVAAAIRKMSTFHGVGGSFNIQQSGDIIPTLKLTQWRKSE